MRSTCPFAVLRYEEDGLELKTDAEQTNEVGVVESTQQLHLTAKLCDVTLPLRQQRLDDGQGLRAPLPTPPHAPRPVDLCEKYIAILTLACATNNVRRVELALEKPRKIKII